MTHQKQPLYWLLGVSGFLLFALATLITGGVTLFQLYVMMPSQAYEAMSTGDWKALNARMMVFETPADFTQAQSALNTRLAKSWVIQDSSDTVRSEYLLGSLNDFKGSDAQAMRHYQKALNAINATWYQKIIYSYYADDIHGSLALLYYNQNKKDAALAELNEIKDIDTQPDAELLSALRDSLENPDRGDFHFTLGKELTHVLLIKDAQQEMALAEKLSSDPETRLQVTDYIKTKMPLTTADLPPMVRYYSLAGDLYEYDNGNQDLGKAAYYYNRAISEKPDFEWAYHQLSGVYQEMKEYDKAMACAQKAAALNPNFYLAQLTMGDIALDRKDYPSATSHYTDAESIVGALHDQYHIGLSANIENEIGYSYELQEQNKQATSHYKKALNLASEGSDDYQYAQDALQRMNSVL